MYAPPPPLSQDRRAFTPNCSSARTADRAMTARTVSHSAAPIRPDSRSSPRKPEYGAPPVRRSLVSHPALRIMLVVGGLALALPYVLAFTPPVQSASVAGTAAPPAADVSYPDIGYVVDAAAAAVEPRAAKDPLQVVQSSFDPVLLERLELSAPATMAEMVTGTENAPAVTTEMLRILAQMTPEQIDALTFLLLSQQDPKAAAAATDQTAALTADAPWVGDWTSGDLNPEEADPVAVAEPAQNDLLAGWFVFEASANEAVIRHIDDPLSAVRVSPGTVLGNLGFVSEIRIEDGRAKVVLSNGDVILSDDSATILAEAEAPRPSEPRRGPPFEIAIATVQIEPQNEPAAGTVASGAAVTSAEPEADIAEAAPTTAPTVAAQTPSTKSAQKQPVAKNGTEAGRYVQVATFKSAANAQVAKNMVVSDGMTGQLRKTTLKGASYHRVLAGPFDPAEIQTALTRVTRLGFRDAFIIR